MATTHDSRATPLPTTGYEALILDMDGVVTDTAAVHATAWRQLFDDFLRSPRAPQDADRRNFSPDDYRRYVDGRSRIDGVEAFLASRRVTLDRGTPDDQPRGTASSDTDPGGPETAWSLANRKDHLFHQALDEQGAHAFPSTVTLLKAARAAGWATAVVTASRNRADVLDRAGIGHLFDVAVDGVVAADKGLAGKPDPATFLEAADQLDVTPSRAVVVEDAQAGVAAGRAGGFGLVIGVDRVGQGEALTAAGADLVVDDLVEVTLSSAVTEPPRQPEDPGPALHPERTGLRSWAYNDYVAAKEGQREALCTLGNGIFATRGAVAESGSGPHYPATYPAGIYNRLTSEVDGHTEAHESLINAPNWLPLTHRSPGGPWFDIDAVEILSYEQRLDLNDAVLHRVVRYRDQDGRITLLREERLVSMAETRLAAIRQVIEPENWSGDVTVRSSIDGTVTNSGTIENRKLANRHLTVVDHGAAEGSSHDAVNAWVTAETVQSHVRVAVATRTTVTGTPPGTSGTPRLLHQAHAAGSEADVAVAPGEPVTVEKVAALCTAREPAVSEPAEAVAADLDVAGNFDQLLARHRKAWGQLWRRFGLTLASSSDSGERAQAIFDLHIFHLLQTVSPAITDRDVSVPARGLHGEGYRGHIFWDELFVFPFLNFRLPHLTRELLLYRWRRLPQARQQARQLGRTGARFPWQSGSDGSEQTPLRLYNPRSGRWMPDNSQRQHHVGLAVAWNVWQHWQVTGDVDFLAGYGAELLVEIARFFADLAEHDPADDRWHLRGLMGPDEYHDGYPGRPGSGLDDNAYTNVLVAWLMGRTLEAYETLQGHHCDDLWERLGLADAELEHWDQLRRRLAVPFQADGYIAQFAGWDNLEELDWDTYRATYDNIGRLDLILEAEGDNTNHYKLAKQADALMLLYLFSAAELVDLLGQLGYSFDPKCLPAMVDYYLSRTADGSTLSHVAHSWVLARADRARSWPLLLEALEADVADTQGGTTAEGIHLGAMAGTVDLVQRGYSGIEARGGILHLAPHLPDDLDRLTFEITYRGHQIEIDIDHREVRIHSRAGAAEPVQLELNGRILHLRPGQHHTAPL